MSKDFISLEEFLAPVRKRVKHPDGSRRDVEGEIRRMQRNPICIACHEQYQKKYPGQPFTIDCEGIYDHEDYEAMQTNFINNFPDELCPPIESVSGQDIRESYDAAYWATKYTVVKNSDGQVVPFEPRWYQKEMLQCTSKYKVDRCGRGTGKTQSAIAEELFKTFQKENNEILIVCPADSQSEKWYKELNFQLEESPALKNSLLSQKQQPFRFYKFRNGSTISIFTAGSAAGRGADSVRSQSPRRMHIEEQDYLNEKDWDALGNFLDRYPGESEFHGTSTPTGARGKYWEMCTKLTRYREFYYPISVHPNWSEDMEINCRAEAKTEERYQHEYLAEFGDLSQGVFKNTFIDIAKTKYVDPNSPTSRGYATCYYDPSKEYYLGVDWNGEGTGTRLRVVEYDVNTKMVKIVDKQTVDFEGFTVYDSVDAVESLNKKWHCKDIYIDQGFGHAQDDILRKRGRESNDPDSKRLANIKTIDFGGSLEFNRIKPNRAPNRPPTKEELERRTKPFMVEGAVMRFEQKLITFSDQDVLLEEQLRSYKVKTYSPHGYANTYTAGHIGDHDLDAFMLALLAVEINHGFYASADAYRLLAQVSYTSNFGSGLVLSQPSKSESSSFDKKKELSGVLSRTRSEPKSTVGLRMDFLKNQANGGGDVFRGGGKRVPSRTGAFSGQPGRYGAPANPYSGRRGR